MNEYQKNSILILKKNYFILSFYRNRKNIEKKIDFNVRIDGSSVNKGTSMKRQ